MKKLTICCAVLMLAVGCGDDVVEPVDAGGDEVDSGGDTVDSGPDDVDSGTDSGTDTDAGSDSGTPDDPDCETYCTAIASACTGDNLQYDPASENASCLSVCASMPVGTAADTAGNSVGCRTYHAGAAAGDPGMHCPHAGPAGDGACGTNCESFCAIALEACTGDNAAFDDLADCMTQCEDFAPGAYSVGAEGDNYGCRLYHLTVATALPDDHCSHINEDSPVCIDP